MKNLQDLERRFLITAGCFLLISLSILCLPLCGRGETGWQKGVETLAGILFWMGLLAGSVNYFLLYRKYREVLLKRMPRERIPYCFLLSGNRIAIGVDLLFVLGLAGTVYTGRTSEVNRTVEFLSLFLTVTCFYLHFLVTGRVFQYIVQGRKKGAKEYERKTQM